MTVNSPNQIRLCEIEPLIKNPSNARKHSPGQIQELAASITAFGFMSAVIIDSAGIILAGNARVQASRELGLKCVPVIVADHLSDSEKRAFAIADNQIALHASWDNEVLKVQLELLKEEGIDLKLVGFSKEEFSQLLDDLDAESRFEDEDAAPEPAEVAVTRLGDLWVLGDHLLVCGDATTDSVYEQLLGGEMADMVFTDSPYNVAYEAPVASDGSARHERIANDDLGSEFGEWLSKACRQMIAHTNGALYLCMSSSELHTLYKAFTEAGGHWSTFLIWGKQTFTMGRSDYQRQFEPILYGWPEGKEHYWCGARDQGDLWLIDRVHTNDLHPTMKPVELVERAITNSSKRDGIVLDPFCGSGTTLIASEKKGRRARVSELEPRYCDVIIKRWQDLTGKQAIHRETGKTFAELNELRTPEVETAGLIGNGQAEERAQ
jgi:DNA modification methylase